MNSLVEAQLPMLEDNYVFILKEPQSGKTAVVDPALAEPVLEALERRRLSLDYILNTHHHFDHIGGNLEIKRETGCQIVGPKKDASRIPGIDIGVTEGDTAPFAQAQVLELDGHTIGHIGFWFPQHQSLFCGDTLFSLGCGRLFEGTPETMWISLNKIASLPDETLIYCTHEYTEANAKFALSLRPHNKELLQAFETIQQTRRQGKFTVPSKLSYEKKLNPFLLSKDATEFAKIRKQKDQF